MCWYYISPKLILILEDWSNAWVFVCLIGVFFCIFFLSVLLFLHWLVICWIYRVVTYKVIFLISMLEIRRVSMWFLPLIVLVLFWVTNIHFPHSYMSSVCSMKVMCWYVCGILIHVTRDMAKRVIVTYFSYEAFFCILVCLYQALGIFHFHICEVSYEWL